MLVDSDDLKAFLITVYQTLNDGLKKNPRKPVADALQVRIDIVGLILTKLIQIEKQGDNHMPIEYGDLIKKMTSVEELQTVTRRTKLGDAVLKLADTVKRSKEKAAYIDQTKVKYASFYRIVKHLLKSGALEKGFFVAKNGEEFGLGYSNKN